MAVGGDDVSALVFDIGSSTAKVGFAGDDGPRAVFPSVVGAVEGNSKNKFVGESSVFVYRDKMDVCAAVANGTVSDWDALETIWDYSFKTRLNVDSAKHPLLVTEAAWKNSLNSPYSPAFFVAKNPALAAFTLGRSTALIIESGADNTSVVPVVDGFILKKAIQKNNVAGNAISSFARNILESNQISVVPHFLVKKKIPVDAGHKPPPDVLHRDRPATKSFTDFSIQRVLTEFKESVFEIAPYGFQQSNLSAKPRRPFEFPDGYNNSFGPERFRIPEIMFNPTINQEYDASVPGIQQLILSSLNACDHEVRATLFQNISVCGGNSLLPGFVERLNNTISNGSAMKHRIWAPGSTAERKYASWIGGSILASTGNFQQMWISKAEYEEKGAAVEKRLP
ncbi:UNVERIFIED_CONTAM: Brahma associated protein 55kD [Siphonaria sp. JEL0065]|nr:Brahma associated protein 55kD [Siphonaria sp. JEL0065]